MPPTRSVGGKTDLSSVFGMRLGLTYLTAMPHNGPMTIHAHIKTESRDCDGTYTGGWTMPFTAEERAERDAADGINDFHEIHFTDRVVAYMVNAYSLDHDGTLTVKRLHDGDVRLSWSEPTEEGHRSVDAVICRDACDDSEPWQRDHTAEAAGY